MSLYEEYHVIAGTKIEEAIMAAISLAASSGRAVVFNFNGVTIRVVGSSNPKLIYRDYWRAMDGCLHRVVGPEPEKVLTDDAMLNDQYLIARRRANHRSWMLRNAKLIKDLSNLEPMELKPGITWSYLTSGHPGENSFAAAERAVTWAMLMQAGLAQGRTIRQVAYTTYGRVVGATDAFFAEEPDEHYGETMLILQALWRWGDELHEWHVTCLAEQ